MAEEGLEISKDTPILTKDQNVTLNQLLSNAKPAINSLLASVYHDAPSMQESDQLEAALRMGNLDSSHYFRPMDLFRFHNHGFDDNTDTALHRLGFEVLSFEGIMNPAPHRLKINGVDLSTPPDQPNFPFMLTVGAFKEKGIAFKEIKLLVEPRAVVLQREADQKRAVEEHIQKVRQLRQAGLM